MFTIALDGLTFGFKNDRDTAARGLRHLKGSVSVMVDSFISGLIEPWNDGGNRMQVNTFGRRRRGKEVSGGRWRWRCDRNHWRADGKIIYYKWTSLGGGGRRVGEVGVWSKSVKDELKNNPMQVNTFGRRGGEEARRWGGEEVRRWGWYRNHWGIH